MKVCVIFNPVARGEKAKQFRSHLAEIARHCTLKPTDAPGAGRRLAAEAVREGFETIVAAGGDGTVNEVLNGMGDCEDGFDRSRFAVLPLGTVNVFAKELRMPSALRAAWVIIERGAETCIDVAEARLVSGGQPQRRLFVQMAGAGVDTRAIELVNWELKKRIGLFAYIVAGVQAVNEAKPQIAVTGGQQSLCGEQVLIGNGRFYGGRYPLFPRGDLRDGLLEVTVLPRVNWLSLARGTLGLFLGQLHRLGGVQHLRGSEIELTSTAPVAFHVEGENVGHLPVRISVRRAVLRVVAPC